MTQEPFFNYDYAPGTFDENNNFMGGTETTFLESHKGKLFAGVGYLNDKTRDEPSPGPQVLVKETKDSPWKVEAVLGSDDKGRIGCLKSITFTTDKEGGSLQPPVSILLVSPHPQRRSASPHHTGREDMTRRESHFAEAIADSTFSSVIR